MLQWSNRSCQGGWGVFLSALARLFLVGDCSLSGANVGISISSNDVRADSKQ